jgi:tRNA(fMet)-specific endonuclease VapC
LIILDTSFLIDYFRNENLSTFIPPGEKAAVTVISYYEIMAGIRRLKSPKEEKFFLHFFSDVEILDFDLAAADIASGIGARMAKEGNRVNAFDILITSIALAHHAGAIITADTDFNEIAKYAGIKIMNYKRVDKTR